MCDNILAIFYNLVISTLKAEQK